MVGHLARRSLGQYDLPLPRPRSHEIMLIVESIDAFAHEWDLELRDVRMWILIREFVLHVLFQVDSIRTAVLDLVSEYIAAFRPDPRAINDKLLSLDVSDPTDVMQSLQKILSDPEILLGAVRTARQDEIQPELDALLGLVIGWSDHMTDAVSTRILGSANRISEAARRRRIEGGDESAFVEKLLGLHLNRRQVERGRAFVAGVVERAGIDGLAALYRSRESLPTPAELDAPGLWLARIEITSGE
jgi:putative hydrolase